MSCLFLEAESFRTPGGWVIDPSAMHKMGSAYLMAHGAGVPVADAETIVEMAKANPLFLSARTFTKPTIPKIIVTVAIT